MRDNAKNMSKAMDEVGVISLGCLAHTLQLSVKAGLESQRAIDDAVSVCRRIATHFGHSTLAKDRLREVQSTIPGLTPHVILQVIRPNWLFPRLTYRILFVNSLLFAIADVIST